MIYMHLLAKLTSKYRFFKKGINWMGRRHPTQYKFHMQITRTWKNPFNYSMIMNMSTMSFDNGTTSTWSAVHVCMCIWNSVIHRAHCISRKWINTTDASLYNRPYLLNDIDIWQQKDINCGIFKDFLAYLCCLMCCPFLHKGSFISQRIIINVWLNMMPEDFMILCS